MLHCLMVTSKDPAFEAYSYYHDWEQGLLNHPQLQTDTLDVYGNPQLLRGFTLRGRYDLIVFTHSIYTALVASRRLQILRGLLLRVRGARVFFMSNEFRSLQDKTQMADALGCRWLISQLNGDDAELLYRPIWQHQVLSLPYGFDTRAFQPTQPADQRSIDIGFRGDYYPSYVGHDDRDLLLDAFNERLRAYPEIKADIQVGERFDRLGWAEFLNNCRALVGHEAGSTRLEVDENIRLFLNAQYKRLSAEQYRNLVLALRENGVFEPPPSGRIAAPRNFEAMATKTLQILLPGRYNDLLEPNVHYVPLERDFSNLEAVITVLGDESAYTKMVERAYSDALAYHSYEQRINTLLSHIGRS